MARIEWVVVLVAATFVTVSSRSAFDTLERAAPLLSDAEARRAYERKYFGGGVDVDNTGCDAHKGCRVGAATPCSPRCLLAVPHRCRLLFCCYLMHVRVLMHSVEGQG
jgi:hypothetical protein